MMKARGAEETVQTQEPLKEDNIDTVDLDNMDKRWFLSCLGLFENSARKDLRQSDPEVLAAQSDHKVPAKRSGPEVPAAQSGPENLASQSDQDYMEEFEPHKRVHRQNEAVSSFTCNECRANFRSEASFDMHNGLKHNVVEDDEDDSDIQFGIDSNASGQLFGVIGEQHLGGEDEQLPVGGELFSV